MFGRIQQTSDREEWFRRNERMIKLNVKRNDPSGRLFKSWMRCFEISKLYYDAVEARDIRPLKRSLNFDGQIDEKNYFEPLKMLMRAEEAHQTIEMRKYDKLGYHILTIAIENKPSCAVELRGQAENSLLDISDLVLLQVIDEQDASIVGIKQFKDDYIVLKKEEFNADRYLKKELNVYFIASGIMNQAFESALDDHRSDSRMQSVIFEQAGQHNQCCEPKIAIKQVPSENGHSNRRLLIDSDTDSDTYDYQYDRDDYDSGDFIVASSEADKRLKQLNDKQRQAVKGILDAKCRPKPYILFGPPGTGKTHTLVEAVAQIHLRSPRSRVLFCANSNTCVDQIFLKIEATGVFSNPDWLVRLRPGMFLASSREARVVVTTNIKSANLKTGNSFDYVFIDEAGHAHEPESLAPCCSLKQDGCLVLAGDPKQLGPVVQFEQAATNGLERSMLERIIEWRIYKRQSETNQYNPIYLTKLIDCYRCDPRILAISNKLFYDDELCCLHQTPRSLLKIMRLTTPVQVLFCKNGEEIQPKNSTSWENRAEINECLSIATRLYKIGFTGDQIGIMSPYKKQVKQLRKTLKETLRVRLNSMLNERFLIKEKKVTMVPKDERARDAARRNEELVRLMGGLTLKNNLEKVELIEKVEWIEKKQDWNCKIDTVDSFQGNEREVVIFSPVRTSTGRQHGFLDDAKRFNVAMSRAKWLLIVVGNEDVLKSSKYYNEFLCNSKQDIKNWPLQSILDSPHRQDRALFHEYP